MDITKKKKNAKLKRENEFLLIAAQKNDVKERIDKTQQNTKYRLRGNIDETINHIMTECNKLAHKKKKKEIRPDTTRGESDSLEIV